MASANSYDQGPQGGQPRPLQMGAKGAYIVRLLMVGDSSCGKTSLVLRFDQNVFSTKFVTTIGVDYRDKMVKVSPDYAGSGVCYFIRVTKSLNVPVTIDHFDIKYRSKVLQCGYNFGTQAGQERFRSLTSNFFGRADGFVLTYDISNRPSFRSCYWMDERHQNKGAAGL